MAQLGNRRRSWRIDSSANPGMHSRCGNRRRSWRIDSSANPGMHSGCGNRRRSWRIDSSRIQACTPDAGTVADPGGSTPPESRHALRHVRGAPGRKRLGPLSHGGGCGIRTREGVNPTRFPSERHRPLGESSTDDVTCCTHRVSWRGPLVRRHHAQLPQGRKAARVSVLCRVCEGSLMCGSGSSGSRPPSAPA